MAVPLLLDDQENTRPFYWTLQRNQHFLRVQLPELIWDELVMIASVDFLTS